MLSFFIGFLTVLMVLDCVILVFLVLLQLPKKEAGAGMAFGGAATDALFGAGSGNVLTKITKWVAGFFFGLAFLLAIIGSSQHRQSGARLLQEELQKKGSAPAASIPATPAPTTPAPSGNLLGSKPAAPATAAPAEKTVTPGTAPATPSTAPATSAPAQPKK